MRRVILTIGAVAALALGTASARADETIIIWKEALAVPVAAAGCAAVGVLVHELFVAERPFGPNGELMKVVLIPVNIVDGNIKAASRESASWPRCCVASAGSASATSNGTASSAARTRFSASPSAEPTGGGSHGPPPQPRPS